MNKPLRTYYKYVFSVGSLFRCAVLAILCHIHNFTKYSDGRGLKDVFYWPEGLCLDMIVVGLFFTTLFWILISYFKFMKRMWFAEMRNFVREVKKIINKNRYEK